jgi:hypothetical protein
MDAVRLPSRAAIRSIWVFLTLGRFAANAPVQRYWTLLDFLGFPRKFPEIRKPQDAIHAATAALHSLDALHTFDGSDLLGLNGQIPMANGQSLTICRPPNPPDPNKGTLFEGLGSGGQEKSDEKAAG